MDDLEACVRDERWKDTWRLRFCVGKWWVLGDFGFPIDGGHDTALAAAQAV